ncbi:MAG: hypothetical protein KKH94_01725 [Candidatus Omnitrophica bacterium]|nr:hypothetical protein [Candidatus Omnitrophota bacterium]
MNGNIQTIFIVISALATVVIAIYTVVAHNLSKEIVKLTEKNDERDIQFKSQLKELYKAIVISNFPCAGASSQEKLRDFEALFRERNKYFEGVFDNI